MNDWNQNGKFDNEDKTIFHSEVSEKNDSNKAQHNKSINVDESVLADWIINGVCALIVLFIFKADIKINGFTAIVSLSCFLKIGWSLFVLFINATSR